MGHTPDEITQHLAERLCWQVARRDEARIARRRYRKQLVDGVYRWDDGAVLDDGFHCLAQVGVMALLAAVRGAAIQRQMLPFVQDGLALRPEDAVWHGAHQCAARVVVPR
jgi:hypothetical protein